MRAALAGRPSWLEHLIHQKVSYSILGQARTWVVGLFSLALVSLVPLVLLLPVFPPQPMAHGPVDPTRNKLMNCSGKRKPSQPGAGRTLDASFDLSPAEGKWNLLLGGTQGNGALGTQGVRPQKQSFLHLLVPEWGEREVLRKFSSQRHIQKPTSTDNTSIPVRACPGGNVWMFLSHISIY